MSISYISIAFYFPALYYPVTSLHIDIVVIKLLYSSDIISSIAYQ